MIARTTSLKKCLFASNIILLAWFFLDMTGVTVGSFNLVESAWKEDGIFFTIYAGILFLFIKKEKIGKYFLSGWLTMWMATQFFSHWFYTIFGASEKKLTAYNQLFGGTYRFLPASDSLLIPDFYHIILHF
ncbi:hypothetical protein [Scatolibacter rhodanostii]|uniref:hypothetical protein n=1 Tax=Scatolibacter rhodanostii TaxID=2014781 RepID=UPI001FA89131|nr:hypothetical protein [Scatolibacter rhodanostii]